jgi:hypothetical protein
MRCKLWIGTLVVALIGSSQGLRAGPPCCEPPQDCFLKRIGPVGGWNPYGGGLLHWWSGFARCGTPDDYCRKPLPRVCWPAYSGHYMWGPTEICCPQCSGTRNGNQDQERPARMPEENRK